MASSFESREGQFLLLLREVYRQERTTGDGAADLESRSKAAQRLALFEGQKLRKLFAIAIDSSGYPTAGVGTLGFRDLLPGFECVCCIQNGHIQISDGRKWHKPNDIACRWIAHFAMASGFNRLSTHDEPERFHRRWRREFFLRQITIALERKICLVWIGSASG